MFEPVEVIKPEAPTVENEQLAVRPDVESTRMVAVEREKMQSRRIQAERHVWGAMTRRGGEEAG